MDEFGLTWLNSAPKIKLLPEPDLRKPYPLSWDEQHKLFQQLPNHLKNMALFAVNTGCRDREICELRWDWEIQIPELPHIIVFIVPGELVKNGEERLIVCNETVREVIEGERGKHPTHVFSFKGRPLSRMLSTGWRQAREKAKLPALHQIRGHFNQLSIN
ncbi:integrase (plasmid) [Legionella adelaidensis]|uniref:Integrase n=1 Tax=Legionella adelaidensis TaxID=45056 RepID=A0A0W0R1H5_9GAMM|nr:tyrosine-type recombinase/integrase [Legionella adelaidensis]KTC64901.1 integrase [Legionella adelaidensis]VEH84837.1 integrase [Legionella adelaidensis]